MGLFGKVFEKKVCDICGGEIGLLGNRKLDDGNLCKECAKKLSPWFDDMDFKLSNFSVEDQDRGKMMEMESVGSQIVAALTGTACGQSMGSMTGNGGYGQQPAFSICCDKCGWVPEDPNQIPKFCPQCGDPIDWNDRK